MRVSGDNSRGFAVRVPLHSAGDRGLEIRALDVWRGQRCLVAALDFAVGPGQLALVTGANGAGKTTLLRVIAGLTPAASGTVSWRGTEVGRLPVERRGEIAYHGHLEALKKHLTVTENLELYHRLWSSALDWRDVLAEVRLEQAAELQLRQLSAGQRRRVALATLRLRGAALWIVDEPTTNLDEDGRTLVARWLRMHIDAGGTAVVATHQPDDLLRPGAVVVEL